MLAWSILGGVGIEHSRIIRKLPVAGWPAVARPFSRAGSLPPPVVAIVNDCKDRMLAAYLAEAEASGIAPLRFFARAYASRAGGDDMAVLEAYLRLDLDIVACLSESHEETLADCLGEAEALVAAALPEADRAAFDAEGIRSLLAIRDYPIVAEFLGRINGLRVSSRNEGDYSELFCDKPFLTAEVAQEGRTFLCCPLQLPTVVGDATDGSFMQVWNSEKAQAIRRSILDGSFAHCCEKTCGALQSRTLPKRAEVADPYLRLIIDHKITRLPRGPTTITMNYDRSCNLACSTCRTGVITLKGRDRDEALAIQAWATHPDHLKYGAYLHFTGSGDAFASHIFHNFLRDFDPEKQPRVRIGLGTNGLLFTETAWDRICNDVIDIACISIDAATAETYARNRGADFELLLANLRFIGGLRASGELKLFGINFVVQDNNYAEMPAFVDLGRAVGADFVFFQQLVNWGTFTAPEFQRRAVHLPEHPRHRDFLDILNDARLADPIVNLHNLSALRDPFPVAAAVDAGQRAAAF
ncbi:MAG TPA: SPASM domain-containing protein [Allosphingosinicella sp.]|jgi:MoaA/NifB/PqqE/SkfB family radical SAM enzyme